VAGTGEYAYFDAAAAAPLHPAARTMLETVVGESWADPAKLYAPARRARMLLEASREAVALAVGARTEEISFVASGTEACHLATTGVLRGRRRRSPPRRRCPAG
jgi:cysteine desulfurase